MKKEMRRDKRNDDETIKSHRLLHSMSFYMDR